MGPHARLGIVLALAAGLGVLGFARLTYQVSLFDLLPQDIRAVKGAKIFYDNFQKTGRLFVTLDHPDEQVAGEAATSLAKTIRATPGLTPQVISEAFWERDPEYVAMLLGYLWVNAPPEQVATLAANTQPDALQPNLEELLEDLAVSSDPAVVAAGSYDPFGLTVPFREGLTDGAPGGGSSTPFASEDGTFRVLFIDAPDERMNYQEATAWIASIREVVATWRSGDPRFADVSISYTGDPAFLSEIATTMERDMTRSVLAVTVLIALLFWWLHRALRPLGLLLLLVGSAGLITLGVAGFFFGSLNIMSMGFAAILIGIVVDYGVVAWQEAKVQRTADARAVYKRVLPPIVWSSSTTAIVFLSLNLSSLPGTRQLGTLVAIGILVGAAIMLGVYLPLITNRPRPELRAPSVSREERSHSIWIAAVAGLAALAALGIKGAPELYDGQSVLHPEHCRAMEAMKHYQEKLLPPDSGRRVPIIVLENDVPSTAQRLEEIEQTLAAAKERGDAKSFFVPTNLWPRPANQRQNLEQLLPIAEREKTMRAAAEEAGFEEEALSLTAAVFAQWRAIAAQAEDTLWPDDAVLSDALEQVIMKGEDGDHFGAVGVVTLTDDPDAAFPPDWLRSLDEGNVYPTGFFYFGESVKPLVRRDLFSVFLPAAGGLLLLLIIVFRDLKDFALAVGCLLFSALIVLGVMSATGLQWNFVNVCAIPLFAGLSVDFCIHMIFSLRHHRGDLPSIRNGISRAIFFCAVSTALAFGSLWLGSTRGLKTLGAVASIGVLVALLTTNYLLPILWRKVHRTKLLG